MTKQETIQRLSDLEDLALARHFQLSPGVRDSVDPMELLTPSEQAERTCLRARLKGMGIVR